MEATFEDKLRAAVSAGWRALVVEAVFLTVVWLVFLGMAESQSSFWLALWGPNATWEMATRISLWAFAFFKVVVWLQAGMLFWAWMWSRALHKTKAVVRTQQGRIDVGMPATAGAR